MIWKQSYPPTPKPVSKRNCDPPGPIGLHCKVGRQRCPKYDHRDWFYQLCGYCFDKALCKLPEYTVIEAAEETDETR